MNYTWSTTQQVRSVILSHWMACCVYVLSTKWIIIYTESFQLEPIRIAFVNSITGAITSGFVSYQPFCLSVRFTVFCVHSWIINLFQRWFTSKPNTLSLVHRGSCWHVTCVVDHALIIIVLCRCTGLVHFCMTSSSDFVMCYFISTEIFTF